MNPLKSNEYFYKEGKDAFTGAFGFFIYERDFDSFAISPVFITNLGLAQWMKGKYEYLPYDSTRDTQYMPNRLRRLSLEEQNKYNVENKLTTNYELKLKPSTGLVSFHPPLESRKRTIIDKCFGLNKPEPEPVEVVPKIEKTDEFIEIVCDKSYKYQS